MKWFAKISKHVKPLFLILFSTYLVFLLVPIIMIHIYFEQSVTQTVRQQVSQSHIQALSTINIHMEALVGDVYREIVKLNFSNEINAVNRMDLAHDRYDGEYVYKIRNVIDTLVNITRLYNEVDSVYYFNYRQNCVISSNSDFVPLDDFIKNEWITFPENVWSASYAMTYTSLPYHNAQTEPMVTVYSPIRQFMASNQELIAVCLPTNVLTNRLYVSGRALNGATMIVSNEGHSIAGSGADLFPDISAEVLLSHISDQAANEGCFEYEHEGQHLIVTYVQSMLLPWIYVNIQPFDAIYNQVIKMNMILLTITSILIIMGFIFSFTISKRIYRPIAGILSDLNARVSTVQKSGKYELTVISKIVRDMVDNEGQLQTMIKRHEGDKKKLLLLKTLNSVDENKSDLVQGYYVCLVFAIDRHQEFLTEYNSDKQEQLRYVFHRACEEVASTYADAVGIPVEGGRFCVLAQFEQLERSYELIQGMFQQLLSELSAIGFPSFSIGVGEAYLDGRHIRTSYQEALEALKYRMIYGHGSLIFYFQVQDRNGAFIYPSEQIEQLITALKANNLQDVQRVLIQIADRIRYDETIQYDNIVYVYYQIRGEIAKFMLNHRVNPTEVFSGEDVLLESISERETIDDIHQWVFDLCRHLIQYRKTSELSRKNYFEQITSVIKMNYWRSNLDINYVASSLGLSYSHLRRKFSEYNPVSFVDYVNQFRIEEAKRLLSGTNDTIETIVEKTGFNNYQSFSRAFKKIEGMTPGRYRTENQIIQN